MLDARTSRSRLRYGRQLPLSTPLSTPVVLDTLASGVAPPPRATVLDTLVAFIMKWSIVPRHLVEVCVEVWSTTSGHALSFHTCWV